jgi:hypothetical protein
MDGRLASSYLGQVDSLVRQNLAQVMWNWNLCGTCTGKPSCIQHTCAWAQADGAEAYWKFHQTMSEAYSPDMLGRRPAINDHQGLLEMVQQIEAPRGALRKEIFEADLAPGQKPPTTYDQDRALNVAAGLILLMDFGILHDAANLMPDGVPRISWRDGVSVDAFVEEAFPRTPESPGIKGILSELRAKKLIKYAKLRMKATNDIRRHLVLDKKEKVVWVFHQGTALRHLLSSSEGDVKDCCPICPLHTRRTATPRSRIRTLVIASKNYIRNCGLRHRTAGYNDDFKEGVRHTCSWQQCTA